MAGTTQQASQNDKLTAGLVGLWSFDGTDVSGTTAYQRLGQGDNRSESNLLEGLNLEAANRSKVLYITSDQYRVSAERSGCDQGIRYRDRVLPTQSSGLLSDVRGDCDGRQQSQQSQNSSFFAASQGRNRQQLAFGDHGDRSARTSALYVLQEAAGERLPSQMVNQDIGIDQMSRHLRLSLETRFPFASKAALIRPAIRQATSQQAGCFSHDALCKRTSKASGSLGELHQPFERLQLVFQAFNVLDHRRGFHRIRLLTRSLAWA